MICDKCHGIPFDLFQGDRSIQYELHESIWDFVLSARKGCHSCRLLLEQRNSQLDPPGSAALHALNLDPCRDGDSYWIEWDNSVDTIVLASGWNHYILEYDSDTGLQTSSTTPVLSAAPDSENLQIIRSWLDNCLSEHEDCRNGDANAPTRLVDVGPSDGSQEPRIVCGKECEEQLARYMTLSYCWGSTTKNSSWTLTTENIDRFRAGIQRNQLPQTFLDVIKLIRKLKERYVWIDALCILQDSPSDWEKEASSMARIYKNSLCTIISPSPDPTKPLFIERDPYLVSPAVLQLFTRNRSHSGTVRFHPILPKWNGKFPSSFKGKNDPGLRESLPTRRRVWCFQEYELSCRTITFTTHQFVWVCKEMQCFEEKFSSFSRPLGELIDRRTLAKDGATAHPHTRLFVRWILRILDFVGLFRLLRLFGRVERVSISYEPCYEPEGEIFSREPSECLGLDRGWEKVVEEITSRDITYWTDRLPALSGLAAKRQQATGDKYLAGLWKSNLRTELLWRVEDQENPVRLPKPDNVPTWSWSTVSGAVGFPRRSFGLNRFESHMPSPIGNEVVIVEADVEVIGENPFGRVKSGYITLQGRLLRASVGTKEHTTVIGRPHHYNASRNLHTPEGRDLGSIYFDDSSFHIKYSSLECLWLDAGVVEDADLEPEPERYTGGFGLALVPQSNPKHQAAYIRVGFVWFSNWVVKHVVDVKQSQFTIV